MPNNSNTTDEHTSQRRAPAQRERGEVSFDDAYIKKSMHWIPELREVFLDLARDQRKSHTKLFNEAIADLLEKNGKLSEELILLLKEFGIR